jgi:hypothetical protein
VTPEGKDNPRDAMLACVARAALVFLNVLGADSVNANKSP